MSAFNYVKFSNIKLSIDLNPFVWGFVFNRQKPTVEDPTLSITFIKILFFSIFIVTDDGSYVPWEETIDVNEETDLSII